MRATRLSIISRRREEPATLTINLLGASTDSGSRGILLRLTLRNRASLSRSPNSQASISRTATPNKIPWLGVCNHSSRKRGAQSASSSKSTMTTQGAKRAALLNAAIFSWRYALPLRPWTGPRTPPTSVISLCRTAWSKLPSTAAVMTSEVSAATGSSIQLEDQLLSVGRSSARQNSFGQVCPSLQKCFHFGQAAGKFHFGSFRAGREE